VIIYTSIALLAFATYHSMSRPLWHLSLNMVDEKSCDVDLTIRGDNNGAIRILSFSNASQDKIDTALAGQDRDRLTIIHVDGKSFKPSFNPPYNDQWDPWYVLVRELDLNAALEKDKSAIKHWIDKYKDQLVQTFKIQQEKKRQVQEGYQNVTEYTKKQLNGHNIHKFATPTVVDFHVNGDGDGSELFPAVKSLFPDASVQLIETVSPSSKTRPRSTLVIVYDTTGGWEGHYDRAQIVLTTLELTDRRPGLRSGIKSIMTSSVLTHLIQSCMVELQCESVFQHHYVYTK
jgi:hypothetical protein